ncbi:cobalamin-binding protein [Betaproteobacteria bacterium]|nr:cobalamin-binding protein [Betaproteobacteria bacterium]GHU25774.1 cobalamin-binding protein [Betaproteobacteria bacterium]
MSAGLPGRNIIVLACACVLTFSAAAARAEAITVTDATGHTVRLEQPAQRIISLAPHLTELLFAAGAGDKVVGTVEFSDWPPAARALPQVGSFTNVDIEAVAALEPDLVVIWGTSQRGNQRERLAALGIPVWVNDNRRVDDIADTLEILGQLAGSANAAHAAAQDFRARLQALRQRYAHAAQIRVFYQVWHQPLMTINDHDLIGAVIKLCGGENVFGTLGQLAPLISVEAVLATRPEVIIASGMDASRPEWLEDWRRWPEIPAVAANNLFFIPPDIIQRHSPRLIDGATLLCEKLDEARSKRH